MDDSMKLALAAFHIRKGDATNSESVFYSRFSGEIDVHENCAVVARWCKTNYILVSTRMPVGNLKFDTLFITFPVDVKESFEF